MRGEVAHRFGETATPMEYAALRVPPDRMVRMRALSDRSRLRACARGEGRRGPAPLVVAGFNYPGHPWLAVPLMIGFSSVMNVLLVALARLGGTMSAPALAHGSINGTAGLAMVLLVGGDSAVAAPVGVVAWVPLAVAAAALMVWSRSRAADAGATLSTDAQ